MRESVIETYLKNRVKEAGGLCPKYKSPERNKVPDRLMLMPTGFFRFAELKATGEEPDDGQYREHLRLKELGFTTLVFDSTEKIDEWFAWFNTTESQLLLLDDPVRFLKSEPHLSLCKV